MLYLLSVLLTHAKKRRQKNDALYRFKTAKGRATTNILKLKLSSGKLSIDRFNKQLTEILQDYLDSKQMLAHAEHADPNTIPYRLTGAISPELKQKISSFFEGQHEMRFSRYPELRENRKALCLELTRLIRNLETCFR